MVASRLVVCTDSQVADVPPGVYKGSYSGLSGPATGLHFHGPAGPTQNAGIIIPVNPPAASFEGSATLTEAQANDLLAGRWYLHIHTETHRGGELRGQVVR